MQDYKDEFHSFQKGAIRLDNAMKGVPDRVPVYAQIHEFAMAELGVSAKDFYTTFDIAGRFSHIEAVHNYGCYN